MGHKAGSMKLNPKRMGGLQKPCLKEITTFLSCLALNGNNDSKCVRYKDLLTTCMEAQAGANAKAAKKSINYHLQRLSRGRK